VCTRHNNNTMQLHQVNNIAYFCRRQIHDIYNSCTLDEIEYLNNIIMAYSYNSNDDEKTWRTVKENNRVRKVVCVIVPTSQKKY